MGVIQETHAFWQQPHRDGREDRLESMKKRSANITGTLWQVGQYDFPI